MTVRPDDPPPAPRDDDARAFRLIIFWIVGFVLLGALLLVFSIWVDWV